uniref:Uncharacterized protein n=1 Tax=Leersia perrieri TaxID=77586 RepID=A0A0D9VEK1_9ORYZ
MEINNNANQLEPRQKITILLNVVVLRCPYKCFHFNSCAEKLREQQVYDRSIEQHSGQNIFSGFNHELLSEALGINTLSAKRAKTTKGERSYG